MAQPTALEIRAALLAKGHTFASVAGRLGLNRSTVTRVAHGRDTSARVKAEIARILGRDPWAAKPKKSAA